jgi:hypothetical protein
VKRPSKSEIQGLVEAYGRRIFSVDRAPTKIQQRLFEKFQALHDKVASKYPHVDMSSDRFWNELQAQATAWWWSRATHGAGTDW